MTLTDKHIAYETQNGKKYKINADYFLGNIADCYGYMFKVTCEHAEFNFMVKLPRAVALKKWKLPNRTEEEKALLALGQALIKKELDRGNEKDGYQITLTESMAKETLEKTLHSLEV